MSSLIKRIDIVYISNPTSLEGYGIVGCVEDNVATVRHENGGIFSIHVSYLSRVETYEEVKDFVSNGRLSNEENRIRSTRRKEFRRLLFEVHKFLKQSLDLKTPNLE